MCLPLPYLINNSNHLHKCSNINSQRITRVVYWALNHGPGIVLSVLYILYNCPHYSLRYPYLRWRNWAFVQQLARDTLLVIGKSEIQIQVHLTTVDVLCSLSNHPDTISSAQFLVRPKEPKFPLWFNCFQNPFQLRISPGGMGGKRQKDKVKLTFWMGPMILLNISVKVNVAWYHWFAYSSVPWPWNYCPRDDW